MSIAHVQKITTTDLGCTLLFTLAILGTILPLMTSISGRSRHSHDVKYVFC